MYITKSPPIIYWHNLLGKRDINDVAQLVVWNDLNNLTFWNSEEARRVSGTLGMRFRPRLKKDHALSVFIDGFSRQVANCTYSQLIKSCTLFFSGIYHYLTNTKLSFMELNYTTSQLPMIHSATQQSIHLTKHTMHTTTVTECSIYHHYLQCVSYILIVWYRTIQNYGGRKPLVD